MVSSLTAQFKRATNPIEDVDEAKKAHRADAKSLIDDYLEKVKSGKAEGIQNAKQFVDMVKLDLLLMGEATDRSENNSDLDEIKINQMTKALDDSDPKIQEMMDRMMGVLNSVNDEADSGLNIKKDIKNPMDKADEEKASLHEEIRKQVMEDMEEDKEEEE